MRNIILILFITILTHLIGCAAKTPDPPVNNYYDEIPEFENLHSFLALNEPNIHTLINFGGDLEHDLIADIFLDYANYGIGFEPFIDYCFNRRFGDIQVDKCTKLVTEMLDGKWRGKLNRIIHQSTNIDRLSRMIAFLHRTIDNTESELAHRLLNLFFDETQSINEPLQRSMANINMASSLHLAGFDKMDEIVISNADDFLKEVDRSDFQISQTNVLNMVSSIAAIDSQRAWKIVDQCIDDDLPRLEAKAAIAGGMMSTDYSKGKALYIQALDDTSRYHIPHVESTHTTFEDAFNQLRVEDQRFLIDEYLHSVVIFGRLPIVPVQKKPYLYPREPELPGWYRDSVYNWLNDKYVVQTRLNMLFRALIEHCGRFPKSRNTYVFIGWALDWIRELDDPYDRYVFLGQLLMIPGAVIPDNVSIARPRIAEIIRSFDGKLPELSYHDSLVQIAVSTNPDQFKSYAGNIDSIANALDVMPLIFNMLKIRRYIHPDNDAGLTDRIISLTDKWTPAENYSEFDYFSDLALIYAGFDNEKAWEMVQRMDDTSGSYPRYLVHLADQTRLYGPGFASRCFDDLKNRYIEWEYKLSNPSLESALVQHLTRVSLQWAEEFTDIIVDYRGNEFPVYSYYTHISDILRESVRYGIRVRDIQRLSGDFQDRLKEDIARLSLDMEKGNENE